MISCSPFRRLPGAKAVRTVMCHVSRSHRGISIIHSMVDAVNWRPRPPWDESTSAEELHALEKESFVAWRRQLAE
ncbi:hypothetical protein HPB51_021406 [Rhipicephalus microplus]|uniref:Uncharacterized protein n=1 Tax=Rhipicephalus microplus TaxID=6941 RepID=A0A9J6F6A6_RHIMP|nr:hypothetical protein HPB51_021406 [Rhipicephalus microplus]